MGSADSITEQEMTRYLLGELSAAETDRFEERYFTNDETFDRLLIVKADLIDHYLHGQLDEKQASKFESFFLTPPRPSPRSRPRPLAAQSRFTGQPIPRATSRSQRRTSIMDE